MYDDSMIFNKKIVEQNMASFEKFRKKAENQEKNLKMWKMNFFIDTNSMSFFMIYSKTSSIKILKK